MLSVAIPAPPPILTTSVIANLHSSRFLDRVQAGKGQSQRFVPAVHAIERLHRISGSALHQVIQGSDDHDSPLFWIEIEADIAVVAARQYLRFRIAVDAASLLDQADEWLTLVSLPVKPP